MERRGHLLMVDGSWVSIGEVERFRKRKLWERVLCCVTLYCSLVSESAPSPIVTSICMVWQETWENGVPCDCGGK